MKPLTTIQAEARAAFPFMAGDMLDTERIKVLQSFLDTQLSLAHAAGKAEIASKVRELTAHSRRKYLHQVVESGSPDHLNDVWREGYNNALVDIEERLNVMFGDTAFPHTEEKN